MKKIEWDPKSTAQLEEIIKEHKKSGKKLIWKKIAENVPGKNDISCYHKFHD